MTTRTSLLEMEDNYRPELLRWRCSVRFVHCPGLSPHLCSSSVHCLLTMDCLLCCGLYTACMGTVCKEEEAANASTRLFASVASTNCDLYPRYPRPTNTDPSAAAGGGGGGRRTTELITLALV